MNVYCIDATPVCSLAIQFFPWNPSAQHAGFKRNATYLVRPDGYVALATESEQASEKLKAFVKKHGLRSSA